MKKAESDLVEAEARRQEAEARCSVLRGTTERLEADLARLPEQVCHSQAKARSRKLDGFSNALSLRFYPCIDLDWMHTALVVGGKRGEAVETVIYARRCRIECGGCC